MWELDHKEDWALKNWCFWTVVLEKTRRVPWSARRSNQLIPKEISPEYSLKWLMLKLELQYFGHVIQRANSLEKTLMLGKIIGRRRSGWQRMRRLDDNINWMDMSEGDSEGQGGLACCNPWDCRGLDTTERLNNSNIVMKAKWKRE